MSESVLKCVSCTSSSADSAPFILPARCTCACLCVVCVCVCVWVCVGVEVCVMHELQRRFCALRLACKVYMCVFVCGVGVYVCLTENDWVCMCGVYVWCVCVSH